MKEMSREYFSVEGGRLSQKRAEIVGPEIDRLIAENDGVSAAGIVTAATPDDSVLHPFFEWNNRHASNLWRRKQANDLLNGYTVKIKYAKPPLKSSENTTYKVRGAHPVGEKEASTGLRKYRSIDQIKESRELVGELVENARSELIGWQTRWSLYNGLHDGFKEAMGPLFDAIDEGLEKDES